MVTESGEWVICGTDWGDPLCIHTVDEAIEYIEEVGFLPLFKNDIPGFSIEERTAPEYWWSGDDEKDPWQWREIIAKQGNIAYGKFFYKKAGFITKKWFPYFANYRRDGYDFDALFDDEKASARQKKIMDLFMDENADKELFTFEMKEIAGFINGGEKNFDGTLAELEMRTYLLVKDFARKRNKKGEEYGWSVSKYSTPEHLWGYDFVTSRYNEDPIESAKVLSLHMIEKFPEAGPEQIKRVLGITTEKKKSNKKKDYPNNLLKAIGLDIKSPSEDQKMGLEYAISLLKESHQEIIHMHYEEGLTYKAIGERIGKSSGRCSQLCRNGRYWLTLPLRKCWIVEGYNGRVAYMDKLAAELSAKYLAEGKNKQASLVVSGVDALEGITKRAATLISRAGIMNNAVLIEVLKTDLWTRCIPGIGYETSKKIAFEMYYESLIDETFEAYKEALDIHYYHDKWKRIKDISVED